MNRVLVIIVTYNAMKWIDRCMESLYASNVTSDIFIVDNRSSDETVLHLKAKHKFARLIESEENLGFGRANNLGMKYAIDQGYEYIYLLNQDAWIVETTFDELLQVHKKNPSFGILSPMQLNAGCAKIDSNFILCCPKDLISDLFCNKVKDVYETEFVMAAHWLITKQCLSRIGGFSPSFPHYGEDHNYLNRVHYQKMRVGIVPKSIGIHDRELRIESKKLKMKKKYLATVVVISDINIGLATNLLFQPIKLLLGAIRYGSLSGFLYVFSLVLSYPKLMKNRKLSKNQSFLT
jgi:N-acetylglucosaminyl-diphospho-decaprenol L-rhamnosyltransferase